MKLNGNLSQINVKDTDVGKDDISLVVHSCYHRIKEEFVVCKRINIL